jgi:hypothetical protein
MFQTVIFFAKKAKNLPVLIIILKSLKGKKYSYIQNANLTRFYGYIPRRFFCSFKSEENLYVFLFIIIQYEH